MNPQANFWKITSIVGILLVVFLAILSLKELKSIAYVGKSDQVIDTISVSGKGEIVSVPDIATFSFTVTENGKTVVDAQAKATAKTNTTLKSVKDSGVADKDIQTLSYTINPHYDYQNGLCPANLPCRPGKSVLTGYDVSQTIQVKVRDLAKAGDLFNSIGSQSVENINSLNFSIDNIDGVKAKARALAITNAQGKAKELAKQLGVTLVRVSSFYDNNEQPVYGYGMGGASFKSADSVAPAMPAPEIPAGEQKVTSNVTITYEIN